MVEGVVFGDAWSLFVLFTWCFALEHPPALEVGMFPIFHLALVGWPSILEKKKRTKCHFWSQTISNKKIPNYSSIPCVSHSQMVSLQKLGHS